MTINKDETAVMKNNKTTHLPKSWLFKGKVAFIAKASICSLVLFLNLSASANTVSKDLTITANIMKKIQSNTLFGNKLIRIEADQDAFVSIYSSSLGTFNPLTIPFRVFSNGTYTLEVNKFNFECGSDSEAQRKDNRDIINVFFDNGSTKLALEKANKGSLVISPNEGYAVPASDGTNVKSNPYPNEGWDAWYRQHQFDIRYDPFPQTNETQSCEGSIAVFATNIM